MGWFRGRKGRNKVGLELLAWLIKLCYLSGR
jgi:hypothetical protein